MRFPALNTSPAIFIIPLMLLWQSVSAHPLAPSLFRITQIDSTSAEILWKQPLRQSQRSQIKPELPAGCTSELVSITHSDDGALMEALLMQCSAALPGQSIRFNGLQSADTYILAETIDVAGRRQSAVLNGDTIEYQIPVAASPWAGRLDFVTMGAHHLLTGVDHMLFILGLSLLLIRRSRALVIAFTAFTIGHTLALFGAWFGLLSISQVVIESLIMISLVWMALEILYLDQTPTGISLRRGPFVLTLLFGLIHGSGFAGSLLNQLVPGKEAVINILAFNLGLELAQIAVVIFVMLTGKALHLQLSWLTDHNRPRLYQAAAYGIGGISCYWLIKLAIG